MISCPNCKAEVNAQAHFCKYCGHQLSSPSSSQVDFPQPEEESKKEEHREEAKGKRILFEVLTYRLGVREVPAQCHLADIGVYFMNTPEEAAKLHRAKAKSTEWHETREVSEPEPQWWFLDYESVNRKDCECITVVRLYRQR